MPSRRTFAKSLLAAGAALPLAEALAQCPPPYAQHLTPAELERIVADVQEVAPQLDAFRRFPLSNSDAPDFV
ncbi:MAG TPA: hypothetical protein VGF28_21050 [Thermoanaerobaculia bacterium]|jgi:hypothetical protein